MKTYFLRNAEKLDPIVVVDDPLKDRVCCLPLCLDMVSHSPDGFSWGYNGSGPSQLAFALLYDVTQCKDFAMEHYMMFRQHVISRLDMKKDHVLTERKIRMWIIEQMIPIAAQIDRLLSN